MITDSRLNEYGFRIMSDGGDVSDFNKNPIMLYCHFRAYRGTKDEVMPLGIVTNVHRDGDQWLGDLSFDGVDDFCKDIEAKWDAGTLRMVSAGIKPIEWSDDPALMVAGQTGPSVTKWKLKEVSVADIGANMGSVALYDNSDKIIDLKDGVPLNLSEIFETKNPSSMNKEQLVQLRKELGLPETATYEECIAEIKLRGSNNEVVQLRKQVNDKDAEIAQLKKDAQAVKIVAMVDEAIREGRIPAGLKDNYVKLAEKDFDEVKKTLDAMPKHTPISEQLVDAEKENAEEHAKLIKMKWDELDKAEKLTELKSKYPEVYKEKFKEKFGKEPA